MGFEQSSDQKKKNEDDIFNTTNEFEVALNHYKNSPKCFKKINTFKRNLRSCKSLRNMQDLKTTRYFEQSGRSFLGSWRVNFKALFPRRVTRSFSLGSSVPNALRQKKLTPYLRLVQRMLLLWLNVFKSSF